MIFNILYAHAYCRCIDKSLIRIPYVGLNKDIFIFAEKNEGVMDVIFCGEDGGTDCEVCGKGTLQVVLEQGIGFQFLICFLVVAFVYI